jgi:hypothetical protein
VVRRPSLVWISGMSIILIALSFAFSLAMRKIILRLHSPMTLLFELAVPLESRTQMRWVVHCE